MKKKVIFISIASVILLLTCFALFLYTRTSQEQMAPERSSGLIGSFALHSSPRFVEVRPGLMFKIDTGSDYSSITEKDLAFLDSLGFKATESTYPELGRNGAGDLLFKTHRITVDLPIYKWNSFTDSTGMKIKQCLFNESNVIRNVDFVPTTLPYSVLGIDFLEKFNVEFKAGEGLLSLYINTPEGYEPCAPLKISNSLIDWLTVSNRYFLPVTVDNVTDNYFFDTGVPRAFIKRPMKQLDPDSPHVTDDTVVNNRGKYPAKADPNGWVTIGDRQGKHIIYYYDTDEESHSINPLNMFDNIDIVFNFPDQMLYFRK